MEYISAFLVSVVAGIVSYYICKWLDRNETMTASPKRNPRSSHSGDFVCARMEYSAFLLALL